MTKALRENSVIQAMLDGTETQIVFLDRNFKFLKINAAFAKASGCDAKALIGKSYFDLFPAEENLELFEKVRDIGEPISLRDKSHTNIIHDKSGRAYFDWVLTPVKDASGYTRGLVLSLYETTDRKNDEEKLQLLTLELEQEINFKEQAEEELRRIPLQIFEAQEKERQALGRELHDQTGQYLTALKLLLSRESRLNPESSGLKEALQVTDDVLKQVRDLSLNLGPPMLGDLGLEAALKWQFDRIKAQTGMTVIFDQSGLKETLPLEVSTAAFRIIQEAITNSIRHAGVKEIKVTVQKLHKRLFLMVSDSGKGFDVDSLELKKSSGLRIMKERARLLGGSLEIDSFLGGGTTITVSLPLTS